ncbi:O-methyltransferase [Sinomonas sp. ASV322]|uniref:O-methyltransferase n=1 Tax=Sinomonas sp. ASV322 TaxID=3041920 RepID=UPI0027DD82AD|nr:O-methyltransferase [Sinomonas sp. ASV322]MDQ4503351.1 O-methyltransferase [Sinomonas sp. ASV322]
MTDKSTSWAYAEGLAVEDTVVARARERSLELGVSPVPPGVGAVLTILAASSKANAVVEVGTGAGVSGVCLLRGLRAGATFTTIDTDVEHLKAARQAFTEAGIPASRVRTIPGRAGAVLPRLNDAAYDLVFIDADKAGTPSYADEGVRLLRPGGLLVINDALDRDRVANPAHRGPAAVALRALHRRLLEDERLDAALLPTGEGLFLASRR